MLVTRTVRIALVGALALTVLNGRPSIAAEDGGSLASPRSLQQTGFPSDLYKWIVPADNPQTSAKIALGRKLFFDSRLSADDKESCSTCHNPAKGFTDQLPTSMGIHNQFGQRNAPTVLNAAFSVLQFWDGRAASLEEQARAPILNPIEMGMKSAEAVVAKIGAIPEYQKDFNDVFGRAPSYDDLSYAIAAYERTLVTFNSPFDHFMSGDSKAISASAQRGWAIFNGKGRCMSCHGWNPTQPLFSDNRFHNIGVSAHKADFVPLAHKALGILEKGATSEQIDQMAIQSDMSGLGRFLVTKNPHDIGGFRTMSLRNLGKSSAMTSTPSITEVKQKLAK